MPTSESVFKYTSCGIDVCSILLETLERYPIASAALKVYTMCNRSNFAARILRVLDCTAVFKSRRRFCYEPL